MADSELQIHVLDVTYGDSIVVRFPDGKVGLVDCATSERDPRDRVPVLSWLEKNRIDTLEFVCLTHPHLDHFAGMVDVLKSIRVKEFWHTVDNVHLLMLEASRAGGLTSLSLLRESFAEMHRRLAEVFHAVYDRSGSMRIRRVCSKSDPLFSAGEVTITALAPQDMDVEYFEKKVREDFDAGLVGKDKSAFNRVSAVLLMEWKGVKVALGGDAPAGVWRRIKESSAQAVRKDLDRSWNVMKVGHHGAADCFFPQMWSHFLARSGADLVVSSDGVTHPSAAFLSSCRGLDRVYCTRRAPSCCAASLGRNARLVLSFAERRAAPKGVPCAGNVTVVIDANGRVEVRPQFPSPKLGCHAP
ncbi:MAG: MBL fold metallo-hydrolase [Armatimonadetes bacterium]|nr:MBL fold metallo-hydrolase [Armatimonadota bacterium]